MTERFLIVDGHEDLSLGALADGRDYLGSAHAIRAAEAEAGFESPNGVCMLGLAELLAARVAVVVATVQTIPRARANPGELSYATVEGAHQQALAHLDLYRRWAATSPHVEIVCARAQLDGVVASWEGDDTPRVGLVLLLENAEPIREPAEVGFWVERGIRLIGPAWHANRYSGDTEDGGPLTPLGRELLREMGRHGLALDLTHMSEEACLEALDTYEGAVVATHAHSRRTAPKPRLLSDRVVEGLVARDGVVGVLPLNWALDASWRISDGKDAVTLAAVVDAIDAVCEIAGDAGHVGLGTDFDGGQGAESAPAELDTIADLPRLATALAARGYPDTDVPAVMGGNWLRFLRHQLPR
ncbi:MAG: membrane dipeptidase [Actinomycetota bacterium]|nr:membrane dipeptidase [Actinomycetota bacterium]